MTRTSSSPQPSRRTGQVLLAGALITAGVLAVAGTGSTSDGVRAGADELDRALVLQDPPPLPGGVLPDAGDDGVERLDPDLRAALRRAVGHAARDGIALRVTSGWRSVEEQEQLLRDAVDEHGSAQEAARWVATPERSAHVSGDAVDIGPRAAAAWLSRHGAAHGLCQVYDNEPWHFELRPDAVDHGCPARYADPTQDPRMQG